MGQPATIDALLNLVPDAPDAVLTHLCTHPELASKQDGHGYSLLHAATSYEHLDLLKALIRQYGVDPNIKDEDGETCLYNAESVDFAREVVDLGVAIDIQNNDGQTAAEKLDDEDEQPQIAAYLRERMEGHTGTSTATSDLNSGSTNISTQANGQTSGPEIAVQAPPPLPNGVQVSVGTMSEGEVGGEPDPEFRRRIEELAARSDFQGEEGQRELRDLVSEAVSGLGDEGQGAPSRRRLE